MCALVSIYANMRLCVCVCVWLCCLSLSLSPFPSLSLCPSLLLSLPLSYLFVQPPSPFPLYHNTEPQTWQTNFPQQQKQKTNVGTSYIVW